MDGYCIEPRHEFADEAVSGTKRNHEDLNALLVTAANGEFSLLYLFGLSRLAREWGIMMPLPKVSERRTAGIATVRVTSGLGLFLGWSGHGEE